MNSNNTDVWIIPPGDDIHVVRIMDYECVLYQEVKRQSWSPTAVHDSAAIVGIINSGDVATSAGVGVRVGANRKRVTTLLRRIAQLRKDGWILNKDFTS